MNKFVPYVATLMVSLAAILPVRADDLLQPAQQTFKPIPSVVPAVKNNAVTHEKIELGKMLFFDPRLSASQIISLTHAITSAREVWTPGPHRSVMLGKRTASGDAFFNAAPTSLNSGTAEPKI